MPETIQYGVEKPKVVKKHVVVIAPEKDVKKLESFMRVLVDVANDMELSAYEDNGTGYFGVDY
jgi:hypothetical protein